MWHSCGRIKSDFLVNNKELVSDWSTIISRTHTRGYPEPPNLNDSVITRTISGSPLIFSRGPRASVNYAFANTHYEIPSGWDTRSGCYVSCSARPSRRKSIRPINDLFYLPLSDEDCFGIHTKPLSSAAAAWNDHGSCYFILTIKNSEQAEHTHAATECEELQKMYDSLGCFSPSTSSDTQYQFSEKQFSSSKSDDSGQSDVKTERPVASLKNDIFLDPIRNESPPCSTEHLATPKVQQIAAPNLNVTPATNCFYFVGKGTEKASVIAQDIYKTPCSQNFLMAKDANARSRKAESPLQNKVDYCRENHSEFDFFTIDNLTSNELAKIFFGPNNNLQSGVLVNGLAIGEPYRGSPSSPHTITSSQPLDNDIAPLFFAPLQPLPETGFGFSVDTLGRANSTHNSIEPPAKIDHPGCFHEADSGTSFTSLQKSEQVRIKIAPIFATRSILRIVMPRSGSDAEQKHIMYKFELIEGHGNDSFFVLCDDDEEDIGSASLNQELVARKEVERIPRVGAAFNGTISAVPGEKEIKMIMNELLSPMQMSRMSPLAPMNFASGCDAPLAKTSVSRPIVLSRSLRQSPMLRQEIFGAETRVVMLSTPHNPVSTLRYRVTPYHYDVRPAATAATKNRALSASVRPARSINTLSSSGPADRHKPAMVDPAWSIDIPPRLNEEYSSGSFSTGILSERNLNSKSVGEFENNSLRNSPMQLDKAEESNLVSLLTTDKGKIPKNLMPPTLKKNIRPPQIPSNQSKQ